MTTNMISQNLNSYENDKLGLVPAEIVGAAMIVRCFTAGWKFTSRTSQGKYPAPRLISSTLGQIEASLNDGNSGSGKSINESCNEVDAVKLPHQETLLNSLSHEKTTEVVKTKVGPRKPKVKVSPRMPYRVYSSSEGINIRVGRTAQDNDALSMDPKYRVDDYWWLHVAGQAGSHVVVCTSTSSFPNVHKDTLVDAALLAVLHSSLCPKSKNGGFPRISATVHYTRCGNISKGVVDVAGLVRLGSGFVGTININTAKYRDRAQRLEGNVQPVNFNDLV